MSALSRTVWFSSRKLFKKQIPCTSIPVRWLNLQEFQSKKLMAHMGLNVQDFRMATRPGDAEMISKTFKQKEYVIKAQILAGGRGKGTFDTGFKGGVKLTKDPAEVVTLVNAMLGNRLVTKQTPPNGVKVNEVMVAQALDIVRETYFAILLDRAFNGPVMVGSPMGGMDIEEVAHTNPDAIFKDPIDIMIGITDEQAYKMAENLQFKGEHTRECADQIKKLYELFVNVDASQVEINPLGETEDGEVVCFDAKINFDDNAKFRQQEIFALDDLEETDPREVEAARHGLNYIGMDGNIGCLVNGAGLAMATMDIVSLHGGRPANFLDCGGGVSSDQVTEAFRILNSDPQVQTILVNVFGGIVNCATIANGVVNACKQVDVRVPIVCRLEGTNVEEARKILRESGYAIQPATDFEEVAKMAVASLPR